MVKKKSWNEFRDTGLVVFINQFLHIFGWAIVFEEIDGEVRDIYPAKVSFKGFSELDTDEAYSKLSRHIKENVDDL